MYEKSAEIIFGQIHYDSDGNLVIPVCGMPFGDENHRDFEQDFFHKSTDFGNGVDTLFTYFDHQKGGRYIPEDVWENPREQIGVAKYAFTNDEGRFYNIIVDRRFRYLRAIEKLAKEKMLGVSSKTDYRVDDPNIPGKIDVWHSFALDLTPSEANKDARILAKGLVDMSEERTGEQPTKSNVAKQVANALQKGIEEGQKSNIAIEPLATEPASEPKVEDTPNANQQYVTIEQFNSLMEQMNNLIKHFSDMQSLIKEIHSRVIEIQEAFPEMATAIGKHIGNAVRGGVGAGVGIIGGNNNGGQKSTNINNKFPANAPGGRRIG